MEQKTVAQLIEELKTLPQDLTVKLFDGRKNLCDGGGEPTSSGIYNFEVEHMHNDISEDEKQYYIDVHGTVPQPFVAICFENDDYDDDGKCTLTESEEMAQLIPEAKLEILETQYSKLETLVKAHLPIISRDGILLSTIDTMDLRQSVKRIYNFLYNEEIKE